MIKENPSGIFVSADEGVTELLLRSTRYHTPVTLVRYDCSYPPHVTVTVTSTLPYAHFYSSTCNTLPAIRCRGSISIRCHCCYSSSEYRCKLDRPTAVMLYCCDSNLKSYLCSIIRLRCWQQVRQIRTSFSFTVIVRLSPIAYTLNILEIS